MTDTIDTQRVRVDKRSGAGALHLLLAEYRRAIEAETFYENLKRSSKTALAQDGMSYSDIPRRVFDELYSLT